ncbi:MAG: hypothetical protein CSA62_12280 [Planctomycetota bacterium]|nr:MAG: hypothetical protein CSA62_12280 [Planctomycetota bacterium]
MKTSAALALALLTTVLLAQSPAERARGLFASELAAGEWQVAASLLDASYQNRSPLRFFDAAHALAKLESHELRALDAKLSQKARSGLAPLLAGLAMRAKGQWAAWFAQAAELMRAPRFAAFAADRGGSDAIRLARAGVAAPELLEHLRRVEALYRNAAWASANTGLALRLLGQYSAARQAYKRALTREGRRAAWILNELGLLAQASGDRCRAEQLLREGAADDADPKGQDSCRGNLARFLMLAAEPQGPRRVERLSEARDLLQEAIQRDSSRTRARYWLARILLEIGPKERLQEP